MPSDHLPPAFIQDCLEGTMVLPWIIPKTMTAPIPQIAKLISSSMRVKPLEFIVQAATGAGISTTSGIRLSSN
jgi:hypothetical protein